MFRGYSDLYEAYAVKHGIGNKFYHALARGHCEEKRIHFEKDTPLEYREEVLQFFAVKGVLSMVADEARKRRERIEATDPRRWRF